MISRTIFTHKTHLDRMKYLLTYLMLLLPGLIYAQTVNDYYRSSIQAYEEERYEDFLKYALKADSLRANHRILVYNVAAGYALNGNPDEAFQKLKSRIGFYAVNDFEEDTDFESLSQSQLAELKKDISLYNESKENSELAFELNVQKFHAEDIAYHEESERFFISDVHNGYIYSVGKRGENPKKEFDLKDLGYWSALGIVFDPKEGNTLWVSSSMMNVFSGYVDSLDGRSVVLKFDISDGELIASYDLPGKHVLGELVISDNGDLYISDSIEPYIYSIRREDTKVEVFHTDHRWVNLQGLDIDQENNQLFISDYITGSYKVDLGTKEVEPIYIRNELLFGTDGVSLYNGNLILLQNGTTPKRISMLSLQNGIGSSLEFLDQALPFLNEPTMGTFVGSEFFFIGNSPWPYYGSESEPLYDEWQPIQIRKLRME